VVDDRLEIAVGKAAGLGGKPERPLDLARADEPASSVARRTFVRMRSAPEAAGEDEPALGADPVPGRLPPRTRGLGLGMERVLVRSG